MANEDKLIVGVWKLVSVMYEDQDTKAMTPIMGEHPRGYQIATPDGRWVSYQSDESGQFQIYAAPFPGPGGKRQISAGGGDFPRWRRDGKEIFYVTPDGQLMAAEVAEQNGTLEVGRVQRLFDGIVTRFGLTYDAAPDGQKFLVVVDEAVQSARPLTLLQNWTATLRK